MLSIIIFHVVLLRLVQDGAACHGETYGYVLLTLK
jgi:hypothetical protein